MYSDFHTHAVPEDASVAALVSAAAPVAVRPGVYWSCEAHPWRPALPERWEALARRADAVGETGLDRVRGIGWEAQLARFRHAAEVADRWRKPLVLHEVRAFDDCRRLLARYPELRILRHGWNTPDAGRLEAALRAGWYVGIGARTPEAALRWFRDHPEWRGRLALESDDDPASLGEAYRRTAGVLGMSPDELRHMQQDNFNRFLKG